MVRYTVLDSWRGICACLVVLLHVPSHGYVLGSPLVQNAYLFVDYFFVLSGFIMATTYGDRIASAADARRFMLLRFARVYPLHVAVLAAFVLYEIAVFASRSITVGDTQNAFRDQYDPYALLTNLLLVHSLNTENELTWNIPSWSISVEFYTYLLFALVTLFWRRFTAAIVAGVLLVSPFLIGWISPTNMEVTYDWGIIRCVFGFCAGMAVHRLLNGRPGLAAAARRRPTVMTLIELATVAGIGLFVHHAGTGRLSLLAPYVFALSVFVFALEGGAVSRALRSPLPVLVGTLSYSIYMIHWLIVKGVEHVVRAVDRITVTMMNPIVEMYGEPMRVWGPVPWQSDLIGLAVLLLVIAVSFVSYHTLERPARRAIRAWAEKRHGRRFAVEDPKGAP